MISVAKLHFFLYIGIILSVFLMGGGRVAAYEAGTLGRDGVRWLLHLVEGAGVVPLASVHHCAFAFDDHCVVGQAFDGQIDVLCYFPFIIVGIIRIGTV